MYSLHEECTGVMIKKNDRGQLMLFEDVNWNDIHCRCMLILECVAFISESHRGHQDSRTGRSALYTPQNSSGSTSSVIWASHLQTTLQYCSESLLVRNQIHFYHVQMTYSSFSSMKGLLPSHMKVPPLLPCFFFPGFDHSPHLLINGNQRNVLRKTKNLQR